MIGRTPFIETADKITSVPALADSKLSELRRDHTRTWWWLREAKVANADPQTPAPKIVTFFTWLLTYLRGYLTGKMAIFLIMI